MKNISMLILKKKRRKIALSMYNDGAMDNYEDELVSIEVEGENDG
jgi:hypothetical protein